MAKNIDFWTLLGLTQAYVSQHYAAALIDRDKQSQLRAYIDKYLRDNDYTVEGVTTRELIDQLYREMAEYSILTPYLGSDEYEEININGWDDIALTYRDGSIVKPNLMSDSLRRRLVQYGVPQDDLEIFLRREDDA